MSYKMSQHSTVEIEVTREPEEVGNAYLISVYNTKRGLADVKHYVPMSLVHEVYDDFIVMEKWKAIELGLRI